MSSCRAAHLEPLTGPKPIDPVVCQVLRERVDGPKPIPPPSPLKPKGIILWTVKCPVVQPLTLTAARCCENVWTGCVSATLDGQMLSRLSLPPLARCRPSADHLRPHTSCECPASVATWWLATRTSWWWMLPLRDPLKTKHANNFCSMKIFQKLKMKIIAVGFQFKQCEWRMCKRTTCSYIIMIE